MLRSILAILAGIAALTVVPCAIETVAGPLLMHLFPRALSNAAALARSNPAHWVMFVGGALGAGTGRTRFFPIGRAR